MSWAGKRKTFYIGILLIVFIVLISPIVYKLYPKPSCFDGKMNQGELGIDCDGPCAKVCVERTSPVQVLWARSFRVSDGVYSAVAYLSNPNFSLGARGVPYTLKLWDEKNVLVWERTGVTDILPNTSFPIFEGLIKTGSRVPSRAFLEFTREPSWERLPEQPNLQVKNKLLTDDNGKPRLSAEILNPNTFPVEDVSVVAVLFDESDIAIGASETVVNRIEKDGLFRAIFTWPEPFTRPVGRVEVFPKFLNTKSN